MSRKRTGTLVPPLADGMWRARVTKTHPDCTTTRPLYSLGTTDKTVALRKLAKLVAELGAGRDPYEAAAAVDAPELVREYAARWLEKREKHGIASVPTERRHLDRHVLQTIGRLPLCDVRAPHVRSILEDVATKSYKKGRAQIVEKRYRTGTILRVRGILHGLFRAAQEEGLIEQNPVTPVRTPRSREVHRERAILTDAEFAQFVACPAADLELRMLSLVARCEGGMRAGDLNRWDWTQIDCVDFAECTVPRAKTGKPQALAIPDVLAPFLRAWWERAGKPDSGPVFPTRRDGRTRKAGGFRASSGGLAARLRRDLFRAGVVRLPPVEVPATKPGARTDLGKQVDGTKLAPNPRDPLYFETAGTLPVDFHSFRRAFNTALAEAGVNVQHAMHLAAHSDPKVHARYVMSTAAMRAVPAAALPRLSVEALTEAVSAKDSLSSEAPRPASIVAAGDDSNDLLDARPENVSLFSGRSRDRTCDFDRVKVALYR
jgi:integrase